MVTDTQSRTALPIQSRIPGSSTEGLGRQHLREDQKEKVEGGEGTGDGEGLGHGCQIL